MKKYFALLLIAIIIVSTLSAAGAVATKKDAAQSVAKPYRDGP
jgi:hypothetical protein